MYNTDVLPSRCECVAISPFDAHVYKCMHAVCDMLTCSAHTYIQSVV